LVRADSGFCRDELLSWCEQHGVDYVVGLAHSLEGIRMLAPEAAVNPVGLLRHAKVRQRVRQPRTTKGHAMKPTPVIEVLVWGKKIGALAADPQLGCYAFAYTLEWKRTRVELAPLTMPLEDHRAVFVFPNFPDGTFHRLPAMLADALPDDFGNALIDAWMTMRGWIRARLHGKTRHRGAGVPARTRLT
jgi:hypothetical protein